MPYKTAVVGAGAWGTALAILLAKGGHEVSLIGRSLSKVQELQKTRENRVYLQGVTLPQQIFITTDAEATRDADLAVVATPFSALSQVFGHLAFARPKGVVWVSKGADATNGEMAHEIAARLLMGCPHGVLSGPSFAQEVAQGLPCALTVASQDAWLRNRTVDLLHGGSVRIYSTEDVIGVEVGGAVKNVIAIAAGLCDGLNYGMNARAALITRGLAETTRLAVAMGGRAQTLAGLTGLGDLVLTATGNLSRNRALGLKLAHGLPVSAIGRTGEPLAEGARCAPALLARAKALGIEMPITEAVAEVVAGRLQPKDAAPLLLARDAKAEA
ncbi:MAG: NAD(P)H-dependent glycerol-3-phosphate dehydrogenase [Burkholderiaceae bacterium]